MNTYSTAAGRRRRRDRLLRPGAGPAARPSSPRGARAGHVLEGRSADALRAACRPSPASGTDGRAARPRRPRRGRRACFSRCPRRPPPSWRRRSLNAASASSIFPARSASATRGRARQRGTRPRPSCPAGAAYGLDRALSARRCERRRWSPVPAAIRRPHCWRCCRSRTRAASRRRHRHRRQVGHLGRRQAPTERTHFSENHGNVAAYSIFAHRHVAEMEQELGTSVTFVPHLVPLDRGILETIYVRVRPGTTGEPIADAFAGGLRARAVRAADGRRAA